MWCFHIVSCSHIPPLLEEPASFDLSFNKSQTLIFLHIAHKILQGITVIFSLPNYASQVEFGQFSLVTAFRYGFFIFAAKPIIVAAVTV